MTVSLFHAIFKTTGSSHISLVPPQFLSENISPSVSQIKMCDINEKNTQETWQSWILRQITSLLHLIESIFSAEEMLSQFQNSTTDIHDVCLYCCEVKPGVAVHAIQAKKEEGKEQAIQGLIIDSFLLSWKHREVVTDPFKYSVP